VYLNRSQFTAWEGKVGVKCDTARLRFVQNKKVHASHPSKKIKIFDGGDQSGATRSEYYLSGTEEKTFLDIPAQAPSAADH